MSERNYNKRQNRTRLREIMSILRKHKLYKGLTPEKLRLILEDLGTIYIKLGQIISTREDILPADYCLELSKLRTNAMLMSTSDICNFIESECQKPIEDIFLSFEDKPIGAASIAQVHAAVLKSGEPVVVKVQRPGIFKTMEQDINLLLRAAGILNKTGVAGDIVDFKMLLNEMWQVTQQEMDFITEANNIEEFAKLNADIAYVSCPKVFKEFSNEHILVMEHVRGIPIDNISELKKQGYDLKGIGAKLTENYVKQILDDAFFHADPHSGNIIIRDGKIIWIDMGMMGRLKKRDQTLIKKAMIAIVEHDVISIKESLLTLGLHSGRINHARLYEDIDNYISRYGGMTLKEINNLNFSEVINEIVGMAANHGISMPEGVTMLGRGVIILESLISQLDPDVDLITVMANHLSTPIYNAVDAEKLVKNSGRSLLMSLKKGIDLPSQLSDLLKMTIKGQTNLNLELSSSEELGSKITMQINKLVLCLIAFALIIGSSILCTIQLSPILFGIPVVALIGYILAAILIIKILWWMRKNK